MKTSKAPFVLAAVLLFALLAPAIASACNCGPDFCQGDSRYPGKLAAKKTAMQNDGYPADLIALMDLDGACVARVDRAPDGFSIKTVKGTTITTLAWDADNERIAREKLKDGRLDVYYKFNASRRFACCEEPKAEERPDWNAAHEVSTGQALRCTLVDGNVVCS